MADHTRHGALLAHPTDTDPCCERAFLTRGRHHSHTQDSAMNDSTHPAGDRLPARMLGITTEQLENLGITLGKPCGDLFRTATFPDGWTRRGDDDSRWSYLYDERGRRRITIYHKPHLYDGDAYMSLCTLTSYLSDCVQDGLEPVTDETWATPAAVAATARNRIRYIDTSIDAWTSIAGRDPNQTEKASKEIAKLTAERDLYAALADRHSANGTEENAR